MRIISQECIKKVRILNEERIVFDTKNLKFTKENARCLYFAVLPGQNRNSKTERNKKWYERAVICRFSTDFAQQMAQIPGKMLKNPQKRQIKLARPLRYVNV